MQTPHVPAGLQLALGHEGLQLPQEETDRGKRGRVNEALFSFLVRNARSAADCFALPPEQVIDPRAQIDSVAPPGSGATSGRLR